MKKMLIASLLLGLVAIARADLLISQYVETDSGTTPKGIELWNSGTTSIDFSTSNLDVLKGVNGGTPSSDFTLTSGILAAGEVWVIGSSDIGTYLDTTFGAGVVNFSDKSFTFNGDDSLVVTLDGTTVDIFGDPGTGDPGAGWAGNGVQTYNQNIAIKSGITTGAAAAWTDPSTRFETISSTPSGVDGLDGFGAAPTSAIPEANTATLLSLAGMLLWFRRKLS